MSIEGGSTATSTKAATSVASHRGKGKATSGDEADALAGAGFLALLTSLETEVAVDVGDTAAQFEAVEVRPLPDDVPQLAALPIPALLAPLTPVLTNDLTMLLAQAGEVAVDKLSTFSDQRSAGAKIGVQSSTTAIGADEPKTALAASPPSAIDVLIEQTVQGLHDRSSKAKGNEFRSGIGAILAESRALNQSAMADVVAREPVLSGALLASGLGDSFLRLGDRAATKSSFSVAGSGVEGLWGQQAFQSGSRVDTPSAVPDPSTVSLESMVADQVSYWVAQGVQNAQLTLDGFGGESVEVNISLKGSEAQIDFRTDQPEIRQLLEGAVAHLKDILKGEGLVLSGVSVGASGQDAAGSQERRNRPDARQATIATKERGQPESVHRAMQSVGRAVDLFV